jgi:hypothetical protein
MSGLRRELGRHSARQFPAVPDQQHFALKKKPGICRAIKGVQEVKRVERVSADAVCTDVIGTVCGQAVGTDVISAIGSLTVVAYAVGAVSSQAVGTNVIGAIGSLTVVAYAVGAVSSQAVGTDVISAIGSLTVVAYTVGTVSSKAVGTNVIGTIGSLTICASVRCIGVRRTTFSNHSTVQCSVIIGNRQSECARCQN